jgi:hypothetical protein
VTLDGATVARIRDLRVSGLTHREIASQLEAEGVATAQGGRWQGATVRAVLLRTGGDPRPASRWPSPEGGLVGADRVELRLRVIDVAVPSRPQSPARLSLSRGAVRTSPRPWSL